MIDAEARLRLDDMLEYARLAVAILGAADAVALAHNPEKRLAVVRIDLNILVDTVRSHVPPLIAELERILKSDPQGKT